MLRASSVMRFPFGDRLGVCCAIGRLRLADRSVDVRATAVFLRLQTASAAVVRDVGCFRDGEVDCCVKQSQPATSNFDYSTMTRLVPDVVYLLADFHCLTRASSHPLLQ